MQEADGLDSDMDLASPVVGTSARSSSQFTGATAEADAERRLLERLQVCADALPGAVPGTDDGVAEQPSESPGDMALDEAAVAAQGRPSESGSVFSPRFSHWAHHLDVDRAARVTQLSAAPGTETWDAAPAGLPRRSTPVEQGSGEPGEPHGRVSTGESPWWKYAFGSEAAASDGEGGSTAREVGSGRPSAAGDAAAVDDVTASVESLARRLSAVIAASAAARAAELAASTAAAAASLRQRRAARTLVRAAKSCPFLLAYHTRRQRAAVVVQAHVRGLLARKASRRAAAGAKARAGADLRARVKGQLTAAEQAKRRAAAAAVVQRHARGWLARRKAASLRAQAAHAALVRISAVAIQRMVRGHLVRRRLERAMRAVAELEAALEATDLEGDGTASSERQHQLGASSVDAAPLPVEDEFPEIDVASVWTPPTFDPPGALGARLSASSDGARSRRSSSAAGAAASLAADEGGGQSSLTAEEKHQAALERSKAAWGFTTMDVAERYLAAASRHRAFLNRQAVHQKWERDPQARLDHLLRKRQGSTSPAKRHGVAGPAADSATASSAARMALRQSKVGHHGGERSLAAEVKAAARGGQTNAGGSPVRAVPTVNL